MTRTTKTTKTPAATWTGAPGELHYLVQPVLVHVGAADLTLDHLRFEARDGVLFVSGTDRFTLAVKRADLAQHTGEPVAVAVPAAVLKSALATIGRRGRHQVRLDLDPGGITLRFHHHSTTDTATDQISLRIPSIPPTRALRFDWRSIIAKALDLPMDATDTATGLNPVYLARFQHATARHEPIVIRGTGRPFRSVIVTVGEDFIGLVMPQRVDPTEADERITSWRNTLTATTAAPVAAAA